MISRRKGRWFGADSVEFRVDGVGLVLDIGGITEHQAEAIERALARAVEAGKAARSAEIARLLGVGV